MHKFLQIGFVALLIIASSSSSSAQEAFEKKATSQFGLNTTDFFARIIGTQNPPETGPIDLFYKVCWPKTKMRFGFGFAGRKSGEVSSNEDEITNQLTFHQLNFVFGFQNQMIQAKRFGAYWGIDLVDFFSSSTVENNFFGESTTLENKSNSFGIGPVLGVTFKISEHFHLNTESTVYVLYNNTSRREAFEGQNINNQDPTTSTGFNYRLQTPLALFLNYTF